MRRDEVMNNDEMPLNVINGQNELHQYLDKVQGTKNYSDFPIMNHNPFICLLSEDLHIKWIKKGVSGDISSSISNYVNEDTGEISTIKSTKGTAFQEQQYVDDVGFTKIYKKNLKEMFSLSSSALKLFGYFIGQLDYKDKEGMVYMSMEDGINFCGYEENSRSLVYRGLIELIQKGFICKTERPWTFFVNPKYIHNGDRIAVFKEYIRIPRKDETVDKRSIENW